MERKKERKNERNKERKKERNKERKKTTTESKKEWNPRGSLYVLTCGTGR